MPELIAVKLSLNLKEINAIKGSQGISGKNFHGSEHNGDNFENNNTMSCSNDVDMRMPIDIQPCAYSMKHDFILSPSWNVVVFSPGAGAGAVTVAPEDLPIKMEVGIEDCLHIEFEYNKSKYHLQVNKNIRKLE